MKKQLTFILALLLIFSCLAGCEDVPMPEYTPAIDLSTPFIGFRLEKTKQADLEGYDRVELEDVLAHVPEYAGYGATVYFDTLTQQEQTIYRIVQYAMDHCQPCIFIDNRLLEEVSVEVEEILYCIALDNPLLEQNVNWQYWGADYVIPNPNPFSNEPGEKLSGIILEVKEFTQEKLEKKKSAILTAERILKDMPANVEDWRKAEYLYRYLGTHVEYFNAQDFGAERDFLYDALVTGKTLCDGYANAFSLLCNMAQIPCVEKMYTPPEDSDEKAGHTWNAVLLDGIWYNVDATASVEVAGDHPHLSRFAFSDELLEYTVDYEKRAPKCEEDLIPPDVTVTKSSKAGSQVKKAWKTVKKTGRKYVIVRFSGGEQKSSVMQKIANSLQKDITYYVDITRTGEAIYYIFPK